MTERHEIAFMIELVHDVLSDAKYEASTFPGDGPELSMKLNEAITFLEKGAEKLVEAEQMLPKYR